MQGLTNGRVKKDLNPEFFNALGEMSSIEETYKGSMRKLNYHSWHLADEAQEHLKRYNQEKTTNRLKAIQCLFKAANCIMGEFSRITGW